MAFKQRAPRTTLMALLASSTFSWASSAVAQEAEATSTNEATSQDGDAQAKPAEVEDAEDEVEEVIVAGATARRLAGSAHIIREEQLERYEYDDPHAILAEVPGLYSRGEDGLGLRPNIGMRGVNPDRSKKVTLLEDGIPFGPAPYSAPAAYFFPLMTRMTSVRAIKGPSAISYGPQTIGGAIDFITRPIPTETTGQIDLAGGEYGYRKAHGYFGSSDGHTGFLLEGTHLGNNGFKELPNGADTGFVRNDWMAKISYNPDPSARLQNEFGLKLTYADEISNESYLGLSNDDFERNPDQRYSASNLDRMEWHRSSLVASHRFKTGPDFSVTTQVYRHDLSRSWRKINRFRGGQLFTILNDPTSAQNSVFYSVLTGQTDSASPGETLLIGPNARQYVSQGVDTRARWNTKSGPLNHRVEYGLSLHYDRIERRHSEDGFLMIGGDLVPDGNPTVVTAFNESASYAVAFHATDAINYKWLTLTPGLRTEIISSKNLNRMNNVSNNASTVAVLPGLGAFASIVEDFGVLAGAYRGFSPPAPGSDEHIEPEYSVNYEAGLRYAKRGTRAEVIFFYNDYSNLTDVCTFSNGCLNEDLDRQFDAGAALIQGAEVFAGHELEISSNLKFPLSASYTLTHSEFLSSFNSGDAIFGVVTEGDELPYVPRHLLNAGLGVEGNAWGIHGDLVYVSATREQPGSAPLSEVLSTDEQFTMNLSGRYALNQHFELYAHVRNIADSRFIVSHRPYGARPNAPRWVQVGLKAGF